MLFSPEVDFMCQSHGKSARVVTVGKNRTIIVILEVRSIEDAECQIRYVLLTVTGIAS